VIFVYDVERSLEKLDPFEQRLIATLALQDYSQEQAARLLSCGRRTVVRRYPQALDNLSGIFLEVNILTRLPGNDVGCEKDVSRG
jgi:DNA-directed RNA polymerase specialized sigma24 family protein